jgi:hypothetical protein
VTSNGDFKRLVRNRMSRSGESYSTARARVRAKSVRAARPLDTSAWRPLELPGVALQVPSDWIDLGTSELYELAHVGPPRSILSGAAALFASEHAPPWVHDLAHPFGGLRVFRSDASDDRSLTATTAPQLHAEALRASGFEDLATYDGHFAHHASTGFRCSRLDRFRRRWTLRQHYFEAGDAAWVLLILATFDHDRDEALIDGVLETVAIE